MSLLSTQFPALASRLQRNPRLFKWLRWLTYGYLGWVLLGFVVISPLLNYVANTVYLQQTGRTLHYDKLGFNPLTLNLSVVNARDNNPDQSVFWEIARADVNLAFWRSLFSFTPGLDELSVTGLRLDVARDVAGKFNFDDIVQHQVALASVADKPDELAENSALPAFFITRTHLQIEQIHYREARASGHYEQAINQLQFTVNQFSTQHETGQAYEFSAHLGEQGQIHGSGEISLATARATGQLQVEQLPLSSITEYLQEQLGFRLNKGDLSLNGAYQLEWQTAFNYQVDNGQVQLSDVALQSHNAGDLSVQLPALTIGQLSLSSHEQRLTIAMVQVDKPQLRSWSNGGETGLLNTLLPSTDHSDNSNSPAISTDEDSPWLIYLDNIVVNQGDIGWTLAELEGREVHIHALDIRAAPVDLSGNNITDVQVSAKVFEAATLSLQGSVNPLSLNGQVDLDIQQFPLDVANGHLQDVIAGTITRGELNTRTQITLVEGEPTRITTNGAVSQFVLTPSNQREEAVSFSQLDWQDALIDLTASRVHLPQVGLKGLDGRFVIHKDGTTNIETLLATPNTAEAAAGEQTDSSSDWLIQLDKFVLEEASFRFHDASLTPNFTAAVQSFNGELTGLSSDPGTRASFQFKGNVDGYAPVSLNGMVQPFLNDPALKAELSFKHLDLGGLSSYSSTYAGWRIERGQLTANLKYHLEEGRILGDNHIEMNQLQLGERIRTGQAMDLPLRLALAMITDSKGVAVLDMRVKGNTNDPQFEIGKIILRALKNTLSKIVTAPFRLLAQLVNSDEELEVLPFNSGSNSILKTANRRLDTLHQALNKRPQLRIDMIGRYDPVSDKRGLQANQANAILLSEGLSSQSLKQKNNQWEDAVQKHFDALDENSSHKLTADEMFEGWIASIAVADSELQQLALTRATIAKQHLVQKFGIDPARVFINSSAQCKEENPAQCRRRAVKIELNNTWDMAALAE